MEDWKLHIILHFLIPSILFILSFLYIEEINLIERIAAIFLGAFIPDVDHLVYLKYIKFPKFKDFLIFNIKSDRYRRGFLLFHNIIFIGILSIIVPIIMFYSIFLSLILLSILIHLIFDLLEDRTIIQITYHWKFGK